MNHFPASRYGPYDSPHREDPRWSLAQHLTASPSFSRSPLLCRFLLYVVGETIEGRHASLTEQQIGVAVFGRAPGYRTDEDNIVRNYARQLRKRLADQFAASPGPMRIEIPVGGYVPTFPAVSTRVSVLQAGHPSPYRADLDVPLKTSDSTRRGRLHIVIFVALYSAVLVTLGMAVAKWHPADHSAAKPLWRSLFSEQGTTYIVPSDAGFNVLEDMSHHSLSLAEYIKSRSLDLPAGPLDAHTDQDLRTQQYTDFESMRIVTALSHLPEFRAGNTIVRFPRDLRVDDLKDANAIILGSPSANPWASLADASANFRIVLGPDMQGASIVNTHPLAGEAVSWASHWNEPAHETFALILLVPNLNGNGSLLVLEGLDVAGTEAAFELLQNAEALKPILAQARRPDGSLRSFELLLRSSSIQSNAAGTRIIASRIH